MSDLLNELNEWGQIGRVPCYPPHLTFHFFNPFNFLNCPTPTARACRVEGRTVEWRHVTVLEVIQRSTEFLQQKGVESPRLQIELLLAHVLKLPRLKLYLNFDRALKPEELDRLRLLVKRRAAREPLQHIVESTSFCGFEIKCTSAALVPRPETELLAERGWQFLSTITTGNPSALDLGAGTGCIAIALAAKAKDALFMRWMCLLTPWPWRRKTWRRTKCRIAFGSIKGMVSQLCLKKRNLI